MKLTACRRSSAALFAYYSSLIVGGGRFHTPLQELTTESRELYPCRFEGHARWNLVISHRRRIALNAQIQSDIRPPEAVFVRSPKPTKGQLCAPQDMWIWEGLGVLGCSRGANSKVRNNVVYTVKTVGEGVELQDGGNTIRLTLSQCAQWTRLSHARTYASVQGWDCHPTETCRLWDVSHPRFTRRHLFVGISRCREPSDVHVV
jgi:hypothetical protein